MGRCRLTGCTNPIRTGCRGLCTGHFGQLSARAVILQHYIRIFLARKELARNQAVKGDDEVVEWDDDKEAERKTASKAHKLYKLLLCILLFVVVKFGRVEKVNNIFGLGGFIGFTNLNAIMQIFDDGECSVVLGFCSSCGRFLRFFMPSPTPLYPLLRVCFSPATRGRK